MVRCCGHWLYQQQRWWCGAVATGFISSKAGGAVLWPLALSTARMVVLCCSHWLYQQQGWWWCAVATGFISSKAGGVVL